MCLEVDCATFQDSFMILTEICDAMFSDHMPVLFEVTLTKVNQLNLMMLLSCAKFLTPPLLVSCQLLLNLDLCHLRVCV